MGRNSPSRRNGEFTKLSLQRAIRWSAAIAVGSLAAWSNAANSELDVQTTSTDLTSSGSYTQGSVPTSINDITFTNNTYSGLTFTINGATTISAGTLNDLDATQSIIVQNSTASSAASLTLNGGGDSVTGADPGDLLYVASGGNLTIQNGIGTFGLSLAASGNFDIAGTASISSAISGAGSITKTGSGSLALSGINTFSGGLIISGGVVSTASNASLGGTSGTAGAVTLNGGTLSITGTATVTNTHAFTIGSNGGTINVVAGTGQYFFNTTNTLLGSGSLTVTGSGTLTKNSGNVRLAQTNTFSGSLALQGGGIFEYGVANAIASSAPIIVNSQGEFALNSGLTLSNSISVSGGRLSFENGTAGTYAGNISLGSGGAEITLQDWYGATVRGGSISSGISGSGTITVDSGTGTGGTLTLAGFNAAAASADIVMSNANLAVNSGSGTAAASVTRSNSLTLNNANLTVTGVSTQNTVDNFGAFNLGVGYTTITVSPNTATAEKVTFTAMGTRAAGAWAAIGGTVGSSTTVGGGNILFSTSPSGANLVGGGGAVNTSSMSVIPWMRNSGGGNALYGYDATLGVVAISGQVAFASAGTTDNATGVGTLTADKTINSLVASGSIVMAGFTLNVTSGAIVNDVNLVIGSDTATPGTLAFGTAEAQLTSRNARTLTINSAITGSGGLTYVGFRSNTDSNLILAGANTYTGVTAFYGSGGNTNIRLTNSLALQNTTLNHISGRSYTMTFGNGGTTGQTAYTFGGLSGNNNINLNNNNTTVGAIALTIGGDNDSTTYSGVLSNTVAGGSIVKIGNGSLTFTGTNTYSGGTTVSSGTLKTGTSGSLGAGNVAVAGSATLDVGNVSSIADGGVVTFSDSSSIKLDASSGTETVGSLIDLSTNVTLATSGTYSAAQLNSYFGDSVFSSGSGETLAVVPEPASLSLIGTIGYSILGRRRRKAC